ncbi:MAG TPA: hypothetical protein VFZ53_24265 [Polyangiaceae bacterium]
MLARYVKRERTPYSFETAAETMDAALRQKLGFRPPRTVLALALARTALETERWQALFNHNWGNVKAGETYPGAYFTCESCEALESELTWFIPEGELDRRDGSVVGKVWLVPPGHPHTRFRAYADALDGALAHVELASSSSHSDTWDALLLGDAVGLVEALTARGYFKRNVLRYARPLVALQEEFAYRLARLPASEFAVPERDAVRALLAPDPVVVAEIAASAGVEAAPERELDATRRHSQTVLVASNAEAPSSEPPGRVA